MLFDGLNKRLCQDNISHIFCNKAKIALQKRRRLLISYLLDGVLAGFMGELAVDFNYVRLRVTASAA
ncbi:hypothetical protein HZ326_5267 [Fusarium oxysporum f. sp. albedinis]|nr:hypothetical protein HZ326_5267 [Fusarium oxysporum f. sp. albedinis]